MTRIFGHICNKRNIVLFRDTQDCVSINNKIALAGLQCQVQILALTIMSTHVHIVIMADCLDKINSFMNTIQKTYSMSYSRRYAPVALTSFKLVFHKALSAQDLRNKIVYVCRNSVHHYVTIFPFAYRFSTARYYFWNEIMGDEDMLKRDLVKISELSLTARRKISFSIPIPDDWLVDRDFMISPLSFLDLSLAREIWRGKTGSFLVDMNKELKDEDGNIITEDIMEFRASLAGDFKVCSLISEALHEKGIASIHHLDSTARDQIARMLKYQGIAPEQIRRCLWLE